MASDYDYHFKDSIIPRPLILNINFLIRSGARELEFLPLYFLTIKNLGSFTVKCNSIYQGLWCEYLLALLFFVNNFTPSA